MPTPRHQQDLLQRLNEAMKHGDANVRQALTSNSLQKSPTARDGEAKRNGDGNGQGANGKGNRGNGKKNGRNNNHNNSRTNNSSSTTTGDNSGGPPEEPKLDKKIKRKLEIATTCSLHGLNANHTDVTCYDDHTTEDNQKTIAKNRADGKMKSHFRELDHAAKKRKSGPS